MFYYFLRIIENHILSLINCYLFHSNILYYKTFFSTQSINKYLYCDYNSVYLGFSRAMHMLGAVTTRGDLSHRGKEKENLRIPVWRLLQGKRPEFLCMELINWGLDSEVASVLCNVKSSSDFWAFMDIYFLGVLTAFENV